MQRTKYFIVACAILGVVTLGTATAVFAQTAQSTANNGQALEIAPPVINAAVNPGATIKSKILLRNVSKGDLIVTGTANDFVAAGEDGTPKVILEPDPDNPYSMKSWVTTPGSLLIVPREIKTMNITIHVPANASPGGHYGIIRFTATAPSLKGTGVSLAASLGSLVLLTVNGKLNESMSVSQFAVGKDGRTGKLFESTPLNFTTKLKNNGNVHEQPVGQIIIKDMFGKQVASLNVNLPPRNVLPNSTRKFDSPLDKSVIGNKKLFGKYTANLTVTYGKDKKTITSSISFWVIPWKLILLVIGVLVAGFFLLRTGIRRYNKAVVSRSRRRR